MAMLATLSFTSCNKDDSPANAIDAQYIYGTWEEEFPELVEGALDRVSLYTFSPTAADYKSGGFGVETTYVFGIMGGQKTNSTGTYTLGDGDKPFHTMQMKLRTDIN